MNTDIILDIGMNIIIFIVSIIMFICIFMYNIFIYLIFVFNICINMIISIYLNIIINTNFG